MSLDALLLCSASEATTLCPALQAQGLRLHHAEDLPSAKALVERHRLRLALASLAAQPMRLQALPQLDLVLLGPDQAEVARRRLRAGAADWLSLPLRGSDVQRMLSAHRRRLDSADSELLSASSLVEAFNRALKAKASERVMLQILRAGRVLTRDESSPGNALAAIQAAVTLAQAASDLQVNVQSDPALRPMLLGTAKAARAVLHLLLSGAHQGATRANVSAIELRDQLQIDVYTDVTLGGNSAYSTAPVHQLVGTVGGRLELTSTTGSGLQVQLSVPLAQP